MNAIGCVAMGSFGLLAVLAVLLHRRGTRTALSSVLWLATGLSAGIALLVVVASWPVGVSVINTSRAVSAAVACAVVLRLGLRPERARGPALTGLLAAMAVLSLLSFYNFGHPQFRDVMRGRPSFVHTWDLRVYFPVAKYFDELGYDGLYLASVKAYADAELGGSLATIGQRRIRDLGTYRMRQISEVAQQIHNVKQRFSRERWAEFKRDMSYFWRSMGPRAYLDTLCDHGANATPAWLLAARLIYGSARASESTFLWAALLDPLLLLLLFGVAWRTCGLRAALVCLVAYGATTLYQHGSNWGGSTLRNDWMVLLGLGVCALRSRRQFLGGILLGWSAMIRAFPVLALVFLAAPVAWERLAAARGRPAGSDEGRASSNLLPLLRVGAGALVVVGVLGALSTATLGWKRSWSAWSDKISLHANKPSPNHVGLTALVGHDPDNLWQNLRARGEDPGQWGPLTARTMKDRWWLIFLGMLLFTSLALLACRGGRLCDAALTGSMMIPIYFYPSNYYLHVLFLWPLLLAARSESGRERDWSVVAAAVLASCSLQGLGWLLPRGHLQFQFWSAVLLATIAFLLVHVIQFHQNRLRH